MLTIEQYNNLSNHIGNARISLDYIFGKATITNDEEAMRFVIDVQKHLESLEDILEFLVVRNVRENPDFDKCMNIFDEIEKTILDRVEFLSKAEMEKILKRNESLGNNIFEKAVELKKVD